MNLFECLGFRRPCRGLADLEVCHELSTPGLGIGCDPGGATGRFDALEPLGLGQAGRRMALQGVTWEQRLGHQATKWTNDMSILSMGEMRRRKVFEFQVCIPNGFSMLFGYMFLGQTSICLSIGTGV